MNESNHRLILLIVVGLVCGFSVGCGYGLVKVSTGAMEPTIPTDSYVAWRSIANADDEVKRFDLVMHTLPLDERRRILGEKGSTRYLFRVVGLGGEKIEIKCGKLFVEGMAMEEPFKTVTSVDDFGPFTVPQGEYFLLGDNRPASDDSRFWKPSTIGKERIVGKVVRIF